MHLDSELSTTTVRETFQIKSKEEIHDSKNVEEQEEHSSSEEVSEEENEEDVEAEFQKIKEMEEKYILQNSAKTPKLINTDTNDSSKEGDEEQSKIESEEEDENGSDDTEGEEVYEDQVIQTINSESKHEANVDNENYPDSVKEEQSTIANNQNNTIDVMQQNSFTNLKTFTEQKSEEDALKTNKMLKLPLLDDNLAKLIDPSIELNPQKIAADVVEALKTSLSHGNVHRVEQNIENKLSKISLNQNAKPTIITDSTATQEQEVELEREQPNADFFENCNEHHEETETYYDDQFDYHITSKTPTSFNSDDYIFHANFIKHYQRANSTDKLR